ncbi:hypothetical protein [Streptomyces gilvosporeus]|uniref:hypothetical protein n=1 Tax=Streptomyces gilvosporeus TaxID=553510 RepID=UPI001F29DFF5|nr:hypothetical protein [Streptomyces gilvosporeus]
MGRPRGSGTIRASRCAPTSAAQGAGLVGRERVSKEFAHVLGTPSGRLGELTACTEILQAAARVPFYADLADHVRQHLDHLRGTLPRP